MPKEVVQKKKYPILEYDRSRDAIINPQLVIDQKRIPAKCVMTFFNDILKDMYNKGKTEIIGQLRSETGISPIYQLNFNNTQIALFHPGVGAPLATGFFEELIALGGSQFIVCGGAGVLDNEIIRGQVLLPVSAIRDEGTSYHYLPPSREVRASKVAVNAIETVLKRHNVPYITTKTWTTDGIYRETREKVLLRRKEGCLTVEMEAAALYAAARFRDVIIAEVLYGGDDVSGPEWDRRDWSENRNIREDLLMLSIEACSII